MNKVYLLAALLGLGACNNSNVQESMPDNILVPFDVELHLRNTEEGAASIVNEKERDSDDDWAKTIKNIVGIPTDWKKAQYGKITFDLFQSTYQEFLAGNIDSSKFEDLKIGWGFEIDDQFFSPNPLLNIIYVAWGQDKSGQWKYRIDLNHNYDMSDDEEHILPVTSGQKVTATAPIPITFQDFINGKVVEKNVAITLSMDEDGTMLYQEYVQGRGKMPYTNDSFSLQASYVDFLHGNIHLLKDTLEDGSPNLLNRIEEHNYYNFNGTEYQYKGVSKDRKHLQFEKFVGNADTLYSNQVGYKMRPIIGENFLTNEPINSATIESDYLLVNFWGSWCFGCNLDKPYMIKAYEKLDPKRVSFLSVATDDSATLSKILIKDNIKWPQIYNTEENNIVEKNKIDGFPTNLLLNKDGVVIANFIGEREIFYESILKHIDRYEKSKESK